MPLSLFSYRGRLLCLFLIFAIPVFAAPYNGEVMRFRQPDSTWVDVRLYGTEYYMSAEGLDGYTVVRDPENGFICYAMLSGDGTELISTGSVYRGTEDSPNSLKSQIGQPKHLRLPLSAIEQKVRASKALLNRSETDQSFSQGPVTGDIKGLFILVDFSDEPAEVPFSEFDNFCNDTGYSGFGNNGSVRTYYRDISGGLLDYQNVVYGYFRAPKTFAYYDGLAQGAGAEQILDAAMKWIDSFGFDFSTLSLNPNKSIKAINLVYTGHPQNWANGMWWHQGTWDGFQGDGVRSSVYCCGTANNPLFLSTIVHENGHMLFNWNDTYKYTDSYGPDGIGTFDLMCNQGNRYNPVPPNPFCILSAGWGQIHDMTGTNENLMDVANDLFYNIYRDVNDTNQYYILENRKMQGRSSVIPDEGLAIWQIDRRGDNQSNDNEVTLIHADNDPYNTTNICFHKGLNTAFGANTEPAAKIHGGNFSGLNISQISQAGDTMYYTVGTTDSVSVVQYKVMGITNELRPVNYLEPGESGSLNIRIGNTGLVGSGNTKVKCQATFNDWLVNVHTGETALGNIGPGEEAAASFSLTVNREAPVGAYVGLTISISDNHNEINYYYVLIVGRQVLIGEPEVSTCSCTFYDNGGYDRNYSNRSVRLTTIYPSTPGKSIQAEFTSFWAEVSDNCGYDYLQIFDGPYCSVPANRNILRIYAIGTITSTDPTGALTFLFLSDGAVSGSGWEALISCTGTDNNPIRVEQPQFIVYPNPVNDKIFVRIDKVDLNGLYLVLINSSGQPVIRQRADQAYVTLDRSQVPDGLYVLELWKNNRLEGSRRLVLNQQGVR